MDPKRTSWGTVADWYHNLLQEENDTYQSELILPNILRLLQIKPGMKILDLACGEGFFTRSFEKEGAKVSGVDISSELIAIARKESPQSIEFSVAPSHDLSFIENNTKEAVTIILALQNIEKMTETLQECGRILLPGGKLYIVLNHPAFRIPKQSSWGYDEKNNVQYRRIDAYIRESKAMIEMEPGKLGGKETISFHRPLQTYFKSLGKSGFLVSRFEEWVSHKKSGKGPRQIAEDRSRKEIPIFLMIEAVKSSLNI